ncbi:hypothetical protein [Sphingosinithalassobacter sp. CS137]|uniref:hypothetical protein n=1 Tax=Sphingosinithalassobacter sp. CS137 TaxID=2762748 RepID=UPI00165DFF1F|nr:hypothetical protein [Sphingosinithalassobacter sp. CS137]
MMLLRHFTPVRAIRDLRFFFASRKRHHYVFMALSLGIVLGILFAFWKDSSFETPYKREIIYVESWPLDRSTEEIIRQQAIDLEEKRAREAELEERRRERQAEFQRLDERLRKWGF